MSPPKPVGQAPYTARFRLTNGGMAPLYVRAGCIVEYRVSSCGRCNQDDLGPVFSCAGFCTCGQPCPPPPTCGACQVDRGEAIAPGAAMALDWLAIRVQTSGQCATPLPAEYYGLTINVYSTAADAVARRNRRAFFGTFPLGGAGPITFDLAAAR